MRRGHITVFFTPPSNSHYLSTEGPGEGVYALQLFTKLGEKAIPMHLGDAEPDVFVPPRVAEAEPQLLCFVGVDVEPLEIARRAVGVDCVIFFFVAEHVQVPGSLGTPVKGN